MSWQAYVDTSLVGSGQVDKAAIYSATGDSKWASSPGFELSPAELQAIVANFKDTNDPKAIMSSGFHVAGQKFITIKADGRSLYGMKGKSGAIVVKTIQAILIAHHGDDTRTQQAASTVETLADYLIGLQY